MDHVIFGYTGKYKLLHAIQSLIFLELLYAVKLDCEIHMSCNPKYCVNHTQPQMNSVVYEYSVFHSFV